MQDFSERDTNVTSYLGGSSEYSQHETGKDVSCSDSFAKTSHHQLDILESSGNLPLSKSEIELANLADSLTNAKADITTLASVTLLAVVVFAFAGIGVANFMRNPTLFYSEYIGYSSDSTRASIVNFLISVLSYTSLVSLVVAVLFSVQKHLIKILSIVFKFASYGFVVSEIFSLLVTDPLAFSLLIAGIFCFGLRKLLSPALIIIRNVLADAVIMYQSFPGLTLLFFFGFTLNSARRLIIVKVIEFSHEHYGIKTFGVYSFAVDITTESSYTPIKMLTLVAMYLVETFIDSFVENVLIAAYTSAYCLLCYQREASETIKYKDLNFFKIFCTKYLVSMCCASGLQVLVTLFKILFHPLFPEDNEIKEVVTALLSFSVGGFMQFVDVCAFACMATREVGYVHGLKCLVGIYSQKRWYTLKNILLVSFSFFLLGITYFSVIELVGTATSIIFSFVFNAHYDSENYDVYFEGLLEALTLLTYILAVPKLILPMLAKKNTAVSTDNVIEIQNI